MLPGFRSRWTMPFSWAAIEGVGNLPRDAEGFVQSGAALARAIGERGTLDELHHQVVGADVVQRADVGMIQRGDGAGFALKALIELLRQRL